MLTSDDTKGDIEKNGQVQRIRTKSSEERSNARPPMMNTNERAPYPSTLPASNSTEISPGLETLQQIISFEKIKEETCSHKDNEYACSYGFSKESNEMSDDEDSGGDVGDGDGDDGGGGGSVRHGRLQVPLSSSSPLGVLGWGKGTRNLLALM